MPPKDQTSAIRTARYEDRAKERGLIRVHPVVPEDGAQMVLDYAERLRALHAEGKPLMPALPPDAPLPPDPVEEMRPIIPEEEIARLQTGLDADAMDILHRVAALLRDGSDEVRRRLAHRVRMTEDVWDGQRRATVSTHHPIAASPSAGIPAC